ncbi:hypothetical protein P2318_23025 [Myxococcaceae bacterium GXIMD 01537]
MKTDANAGLYCELYWGTSLSEAWTFGPELPRVLAAPDEKAPLPLYGFELPDEGVLLAERTEQGYRVFVPPGARVERSQNQDDFRAVSEGQLLQHEGRPCVELTPGVRLRVIHGQLALHLQPSVVKERVGRLRLRELASLALAVMLFLSAPVGFLIAGPTPERMAESNARAIQQAREKEAERRKAMGLERPARPLTDAERQQQQQQDGGTRVTVPASFRVH